MSLTYGVTIIINEINDRLLCAGFPRVTGYPSKIIDISEWPTDQIVTCCIGATDFMENNLFWNLSEITAWIRTSGLKTITAKAEAIPSDSPYNWSTKIIVSFVFASSADATFFKLGCPSHVYS